jgi:protein gp37
MNWEQWTGCYKVSDGCTYCYFYGPFSKRHGQNTVIKTDDFSKPVAKSAKGAYKIPSGKIVATCFASDFFIAEADEWRTEAWAMIKERSDLEFLILTKRIDRFEAALPSDWGDGYDNTVLRTPLYPVGLGIDISPL